MRILILILAVSLFLLKDVHAQSFAGKDDIKFWQWYNSKPSVEVTYGNSNISFGNTGYNFAPSGLIEMNLGFTSKNISDFGKNIVRYKNRFIFLGYSSTDNSTRQTSSGINSNLWKFGFGNKSGYGVSLSKTASILPYSSSTFNWSNFNYNKPNDINSNISEQEYYAAIDNMAGVFRFGSSFEAGINLNVIKGFSIQPKYEIADIFPRHLVGYQMMSSAIELTGFTMLEMFTKKIIRNSPVAGTFVNFLLLNAYQYGFYQLKKDQMFWPFTSTAPMRYETFKLGMSFVF